MHKRIKATYAAVLAGALFAVAIPLSTNAANSILDRATAKGGASHILAKPTPDRAEKSIGGVARTQASVEGELGGSRRDLERDLPVYQNEEVTTGKDARAVLRFRDGSVLMIGADAEVVLDDYVYGNSGGVITLIKGALRFTSGKMGRLGLKIKMPVATIGIRGTDFWAGETRGGYGVLLVRGEVDVTNAAGTVTLRAPHEGTFIATDGSAPGAATIWKDRDQQKALAGVAFTTGPLCTMLQKVAKDLFRSCI
jgi:hypothetical protein